MIVFLHQSPGFLTRLVPCHKLAVVLLLTGVLLLVGSPTAVSFELPNYDPWYYQSREQGYRFTVPDKAQHFYGSALLNEVNKRLPLPGIDIMGPVLTLTAGFMYEVWQDQQGIGFSQRDLFADAAGIAASQLSSEDVVLWLDYSTQDRVIMFNVALRFGR